MILHRGTYRFSADGNRSTGSRLYNPTREGSRECCKDKVVIINMIRIRIKEGRDKCCGGIMVHDHLVIPKCPKKKQSSNQSIRKRKPTAVISKYYFIEMIPGPIDDTKQQSGQVVMALRLRQYSYSADPGINQLATNTFLTAN